MAVDNILYTCDIRLNVLIDKIVSSANLVIDWFRNNYMKLNESKCHLLVCGNKEEVSIAKIGNTSLIETHEVKLLGTTIDRQLNFKHHVSSIYGKAGYKLNVLSRLCKILPLHKRIILKNAFVLSLFAFSPLIGMFVDRDTNSKIDALHYRALKIVYRDYTSFDNLLIRNQSMRVHHRNIQTRCFRLILVLHHYSCLKYFAK